MGEPEYHPRCRQAHPVLAPPVNHRTSGCLLPPPPCTQAMEAAGAAAGLGDEIELLRLRLDVAETEKCEAAQQVASECCRR